MILLTVVRLILYSGDICLEYDVSEVYLPDLKSGVPLARCFR